jgi:Transposase and inactivated derivatives
VNRTVSNEEIKKYYIYTQIRFMEDFDYKAMEALAPEQLKSGKPLFGKGGAFAPLLEKILNAAPEGEMDAHMDCEERSLANRRNGYTSKQVQPGMGEVGIHTPRDRDSRFEPEFIEKRKCVLADSVSDRIIGLYALGNSTRGMRGIGRVGLSGLSQHRKEMDNASLQLGANRSTIGY